MLRTGLWNIRTQSTGKLVSDEHICLEDALSTPCTVIWTSREECENVKGSGTSNQGDRVQKLTRRTRGVQRVQMLLGRAPSGTPQRRARSCRGPFPSHAGPACRTRQERTCTPPDRRCANCMPQRWSGARPCWAIRGRVCVLLRIREVYWRAWDRLYSRAGLFLAPCQSRRLRQVAPLIAVRYFFWLARLLSMVSIAEPHLFSVSRSGRPLLVFERIHRSAKSKRRLEHVRAQHFSREECCDKVPAKSLDPVRHLRASW